MKAVTDMEICILYNEEVRQNAFVVCGFAADVVNLQAKSAILVLKKSHNDGIIML